MRSCYFFFEFIQYRVAATKQYRAASRSADNKCPFSNLQCRFFVGLRYDI